RDVLALPGRRLGTRRALPLVARGRMIERAVRDQPLRDPLPRLVPDVDVGVYELLPAAQHAGVGDDVLADGGREVIDGEIERPGVEAPVLPETGRRGEDARDVDRRRRHAAVE